VAGKSRGYAEFSAAGPAFPAGSGCEWALGSLRKVGQDASVQPVWLCVIRLVLKLVEAAFKQLANRLDRCGRVWSCSSDD
jgi:hypothetical protein